MYKRQVVDGLLSTGGKTVRRIGGAKTIGEAAKIRRERLQALRDRLKARRDGAARGKPDKPVAPAKRDGGQTVLGRYPRYVELSDELNARRFEIPTPVWNRMTPAEQWAANQRFLDRTISRGDDIVLASPIEDLPPKSSFAKELGYMRSKGYRVSEDGKKLLPPRTKK